MSKYILSIFFFLSMLPDVFSQTELDKFSYVIIPEQFEFLDERDKYQLNSIAEFLFNKHGFHAFKSELSPNAKRCDGLYMSLVSEPVMLKTRFVIILKDCNGFEIYRSQAGDSKIKEFKRSYQDALRKAFLSIEHLGVNQKEIVFFEEESETVPSNRNTPLTEVAATGTTEGKLEGEQLTENNSESKVPQGKFSSYVYNGNSYMLRKTKEGFLLYEETNTAVDGFLLMGKIEADEDNKFYFTDTSDIIFSASFDATENLILTKGSILEVYKKVN